MGTPQATARVGVADLKEKVRQSKERLQENATVQLIEASLIKRDPDQPRKHFDHAGLKSLAASIKEVGQKIPILVEPTDDPKNPYIIVDGERRWRACLILGKHHTIRALVLPSGGGANERFVHSIVANLGREGHTPLEVALALKRLKEMDFSTQQIAAMCAKSVPWVFQHLSLVKLDPRVAAMMDPSVRKPRQGGVCFSVALLLTSLPRDLQFEIAKEIHGKGMRMLPAMHHVRTTALEHGHKVGYGKHPRKSRASLMNFLERLAENVEGFVVPASGASLQEMLLSFPIGQLFSAADTVKRLQKPLEKLLRTITEVAERKGSN